MVSPIDDRSITPSSPRFTPIPKEDLSYSKLAVMGIFLSIIPVLVGWGILVLLSLPLKGWNIIQQCRGKEQIHWVNTLIREDFDLLSLIIRYPCSKRYHFTPGEGKPILLVHGYLHNASAWYAMIDRLKEEKLGPIYAIDLGDGSVSGKYWPIQKYAEQVLGMTKKITEETGRNDCSIVAHSMGTLVVTKFAQMLPPQNKVDIVALGGPLKGAPLSSYMGNGPNGREMVPESPFLNEIQPFLDNLPENISMRRIATYGDGIVPVDSATRSTNPDTDVVFEDIGHAGLLSSTRVADKVCEWLKLSRQKTV